MGKKGFQEGCVRFKIDNYNNTHVNSVVNPPVPSDPNEAMRFDNKSDEDVVYRSGYYEPLRPVDQLIRNDEDSKPAQRKKKKGRIPRQLNMFIIYRRDKSSLPKFKGLRAHVVTDEISKMWEEEPLEVKEYFAALARMAKKVHKETYGEDYKYRPGPYKKPMKNDKSKKEIKEKSLDKPNTQATTQQQLLTPETSPVVLTLQTSSPVLEEPLLVESNFPQLSAIYPLPQGLPPPPDRQQYLLTPESNSDSPVSSPLEPELNFAGFAMFPPLNTVVPGQQAITSSQVNNPCNNYDAINLLKIPQQQGIDISSLSTTDLLQIIESFDSAQNNDDSIDGILQQGVDNSLLPTNNDFPLFDDAEQQPYNTSYVQTNEQDMMLLSEYFNTTKCNDNPFFDIVQHQAYQTNFLEKSFDNDTIEQQQHEQDFDFFNFSQWTDDISNIVTFDSNLFKKSE